MFLEPIKAEIKEPKVYTYILGLEAVGASSQAKLNNIRIAK